MSEGSPFTCVLDARARLGESPVWSVAEQVLYWVDIKGRVLHRFDPATGVDEAMAMPEDIGSVVLVEGGGFIAALRTGLFFVDADGTVRERLAVNPEDHAVSRFNDGRTDPAGRFLVGTIDEPKAGGRAHLYRFDEGGLEPLVGGLLTSNGLAFSPDGTWLYHSDTPAFTVYRQRYDIETGEIGEREEWVRLTPTETDRGRPDGAAVDIEGCYWTALFEGGRIQRYSPQGELIAEYPVPAQCPTMIAFGGADLQTIFVTSARDGRPEEELARLPQSGGIFSMRVPVPGLPEPLFRRPVR